MSPRARLLCVAILGAVLLSGGGYYAFKGSGGPDRRRPPIEPSVQERPDLSTRFQRIRTTLSRHDDAERSGVVREILRFQDAAIAPLEEEAQRVLRVAEEGPFVACLLECLGAIGTPRAERALLALIHDAAREGLPPASFVSALSAFPERSRPLALRAVLAAIRAAKDDVTATAYVEALPRHARPEDAALLNDAAASLAPPRRDALVRLAEELDRRLASEMLARLESVADAERILVDPSAAQPKGLPPDAARLLAEGAQAAQATPPSKQVRLSAVHWLEGSATVEAIRVLERASPGFFQAIDALARIAGRGDKEAIAALKRLNDTTPRPELVQRLTVYATEATAPLLAEWASDPVIPHELSSRARKLAESLRHGPR